MEQNVYIKTIGLFFFMYSALDMEEELLNKVWTRDKSMCQHCEKKLLTIVDPSQAYLKRLSEMKEIPVYKWLTECWKCHKKTPVVSYSFVLGFNFEIGSVMKLDNVLVQNYEFVRRTPKYANVMNFCIHCGSPYGNSYVSRELIEMSLNEVDMKELVDSTIPNILSLEDLLPQAALRSYVERLQDGVIHHIDGNPDNNRLDNLILLCRSCHGKIGLGSGYYRKKREKSKIRREKKQADKWRKNYYAKRAR